MKKQLTYNSPTIEVVEVAMESGIAQSTPKSGTTGDVVYNPGEDNYEF